MNIVRRCATALVILCTFTGSVHGTCTQKSDCTPETCWNDLNSIDDGNDPNKDYKYNCRTADGVCMYIYSGLWESDEKQYTVCQKDLSFVDKVVRPCTQDSDCSSLSCWFDKYAVDDSEGSWVTANTAANYYYSCRTSDGVCMHKYIGLFTDGEPEVCQRYRSSSFEGDAVASGPSDTANSAATMSEVGGIVMLIAMASTGIL
mmetsp:Transcript_2997/g.6080  ORF Transcript_2997/g.6080 Transcript_2997/m.6080 type:complete len:203 (+) Transcript_2997:2881-3489(+)